MQTDRHILSQPFGHARFFLKSALAFGGVLGAVELLSNFSDELDKAKEAFAGNRGALPILFIAFIVLHLMGEILLRRFRLQLERRRSSPAEPRRRADVKARRKQRLKTRR